ncbi:MAG: hypothetical protein EA398_03990 [Deltaproteobacteria bacterium]|nr:MAG: hypothetical protein EA398_03990 [Deltaproteobacteria bacterium]
MTGKESGVRFRYGALARACIMLVVPSLLLAAGCTSRGSSTGDERPLVVTTTTMLEDLVGIVGGDDIRVAGLMPVGADPHTYQPVPSDARTVSSSALVIMNGLHLEGWIERLVRTAGGERPVVAVGEGGTVIEDEDAPGGVDPHIWFDVGRWIIATDEVERALRSLLAEDEEAVLRIERRAAEYRETLRSLDTWVRERVASIDASRRVLVTSHDAFGYFGMAYGVQVEAVQGISTEQEASQRDLVRVIDLVRARALPAVFAETSVNPGLIGQVARETGASLAGPLYSDSLGEPGGAAGTYVGMVEENVRMIVEGLGGTFVPFEAPAP